MTWGPLSSAFGRKPLAGESVSRSEAAGAIRCRVLPIEAMTPDEAAQLHGLLFDLDDTLLDRGQLTEAAYSALFRLREAGLTLIAVTGRPAGWADVLVRLWPVRAIVAENGAVVVEASDSGPKWRDPIDVAARHTRRRELIDLVARMRSEFPGIQSADDAQARFTDHTFDIGERCSPARALVDAAAAFALERGARVHRSSVHLHVGFDAEDKASGTANWLVRGLGEDPATVRRRYAFIGDSENDEACFSGFQTSIAVANWSRGSSGIGPRYITHRAMGSGFAEAAGVLVARRQPRGIPVP